EPSATPEPTATPTPEPTTTPEPTVSPESAETPGGTPDGGNDTEESQTAVPERDPENSEEWTMKPDKGNTTAPIVGQGESRDAVEDSDDDGSIPGYVWMIGGIFIGVAIATAAALIHKAKNE
ncbi:MAG: hypothetical protein J6Y10_04065, partial [Lachnospiraceae bacterium]|nr:hypothetical protein [Lachnospiraceae bacterium]